VACEKPRSCFLEMSFFVHLFKLLCSLKSSLLLVSMCIFEGRNSSSPQSSIPFPDHVVVRKYWQGSTNDEMKDLINGHQLNFCDTASSIHVPLSRNDGWRCWDEFHESTTSTTSTYCCLDVADTMFSVIERLIPDISTV
jgi:hypothetical protein